MAGLVSFIALFFLSRLSLALPAIALQRNDVTLGAAWTATEHNTWRLFWAYFFCALPAQELFNLFFRLLPLDSGRATMTAIYTASDLVWFLAAMIPVGMLSLAFRHFFERSK